MSLILQLLELTIVWAIAILPRAEDLTGLTTAIRRPRRLSAARTHGLGMSCDHNGPPHIPEANRLLNLSPGARFFELLFDVLGFFLGHTFLNG